MQDMRFSEAVVVFKVGVGSLTHEVRQKAPWSVNFADDICGKSIEQAGEKTEEVEVCFGAKRNEGQRD